MALVESLAAGTPVVGARHGGLAEIVDSDAIGRLFDPGPVLDGAPNPFDVAQAILAVLAAGRSPATDAACRERARRFGWTTLGSKYEALLLELAAAEHDVAVLRAPRGVAA